MRLPIHQYGVVVDLRVGASDKREQSLRSRQHPIPHPIDVPALLDTGADVSLLDRSIPRALKLTPTNIVTIRCLDTQDGEEQRLAYDTSVRFVTGDDVSAPFICELAEHSFGTLPYKALLGRDLLRFCSFEYNGPYAEVIFRVGASP